VSDSEQFHRGVEIAVRVIEKFLRDEDMWHDSLHPQAPALACLRRALAEIAKLPAMIADLDRLREALEGVEWIATTVVSGRIVGACPECGTTKRGPHEMRCALGRALDRPECGGAS